jgi:hypothetical protein
MAVLHVASTLPDAPIITPSGMAIADAIPLVAKIRTVSLSGVEISDR